MTTKANVTLIDYKPSTAIQRDEVLEGLQHPVKQLPPKLFYDERGSQLFDQITELDEYYVTRTELNIMQDYIDDIVSLIGVGCLLIEYGSGSSVKTRLLLSHLSDMSGYIPIDISREHLQRSAEAVAEAYPNLEVLPVCADYSKSFDLPLPTKPVNRRVVYFPGSTIGNFHPREAEAFLTQMRGVCGPDGGVLIGVDLKKPTDMLNRAYNDNAGITAQFNLNLLRRLNRELGTNFTLERFFHDAFYNKEQSRIEMHLVSKEDQTVQLDGRAIHFNAGECIWTESSYKYSLDEFAQLAERAGLHVHTVWTDDRQLFSVQYLTVV